MAWTAAARWLIWYLCSWSSVSMTSTSASWGAGWLGRGLEHPMEDGNWGLEVVFSRSDGGVAGGVAGTWVESKIWPHWDDGECDRTTLSTDCLLSLLGLKQYKMEGCCGCVKERIFIECLILGSRFYIEELTFFTFTFLVSKRIYMPIIVFWPTKFIMFYGGSTWLID